MPKTKNDKSAVSMIIVCQATILKTKIGRKSTIPNPFPHPVEMWVEVLKNEINIDMTETEIETIGHL